MYDAAHGGMHIWMGKVRSWGVAFGVYGRGGVRGNFVLLLVYVELYETPNIVRRRESH